MNSLHNNSVSAKTSDKHSAASQVSRRNFLRASAVSVAGGSLLAAGTEAAAVPVPVAPASRESHMKLSLAAYSFNKQMVRRGTEDQLSAAEMRLEEFVHFCADHNLDGTELTGYYFPKDVTNKYLVNLKLLTHRLGLDISGTAIGNDFCLPDGDKRDTQLKMCRDWIDYAATMGAPVIRIFAGKVPKGDKEPEAIKRCVAGINSSLEYAAKKGVLLALENHGGVTATPAQMLKIIEQVDDSPWFGVNFDSGNFRTDDPYRDLEIIAPLAVNAQIKVAMHADGGKKPADLKRIVKILKDAGYRGYVTLEYEEKDPMVEIPKYLDQLRELIHA